MGWLQRPIIHGSYGQGKSGKIQMVRGSQGIQKYHGAKVNKDAEKNRTVARTLHTAVQNFSARFARRLFILLLFHLFCRPCF